MSATHDGVWVTTRKAIADHFMEQAPGMTLRLEHDGATTHLLIDRAAKRNAFDMAMWQALPGLLEEAAVRSECRLLIVRAAEEGAFCAGADIRELLANKDDAAWRAANQRRSIRCSIRWRGSCCRRLPSSTAIAWAAAAVSRWRATCGWRRHGRGSGLRRPSSVWSIRCTM